MHTRRDKTIRWERRPEARPTELLEAALHVFASRGYRTTRLEEVAAAAGVTKGSVYHYFANKEELLLRALEQYQERALGRVEEALRGERGPASAKLRLFFEKGFGTADPARFDVLHLLQTTAHDAPDVYRQWLASGPVKGWRVLARIIDEGRASGEFRADVDAEVAARVFVTGLIGQLIWQRHAGTVPALRVDQAHLVNSSAELLLASLRPAAPRRRRTPRARSR